MFGRLFAIAKNSFTEVTRQPIYGIIVLIGMVAIPLSAVIAANTMETGGEGEIKLVMDMGLGTILMVGLVLSVLSATQVVSREIEVKTAGAVISKPVSRTVLVAGKFLGVSAAMWVASYLLTISLLMTLRMDVPYSVSYTVDWPVLVAEVGALSVVLGAAAYANYFYRWNLTSTAVKSALVVFTLAILILLVVGKDWNIWFETPQHWDCERTIPAASGVAGWEAFASRDAGAVVAAAVLVALGVWMLSSVAVAASTRLNVVSNVLVCAAVFFVGMVSHYLFGWSADASWGTWEVPRGEQGLEISGYVRTSAPASRAIPGVQISGLPGSVRTDAEGFYQAWVGKGGWGTVVPRDSRFSFSPSDRVYPVVEAQWIEQDYTAFAVTRGWVLGLRKAWQKAAWTAYHVVPSFQSFWVADQLIRPDPYVPWGYVGRAAVYACMWCGALVAFASFLFEKREII